MTTLNFVPVGNSLRGVSDYRARHPLHPSGLRCPLSLQLPSPHHAPEGQLSGRVQTPIRRPQCPDTRKEVLRVAKPASKRGLEVQGALSGDYSQLSGYQ